MQNRYPCTRYHCDESTRPSTVTPQPTPQTTTFAVQPTSTPTAQPITTTTTSRLYFGKFYLHFIWL